MCRTNKSERTGCPDGATSELEETVDRIEPIPLSPRKAIQLVAVVADWSAHHGTDVCRHAAASDSVPLWREPRRKPAVDEPGVQRQRLAAEHVEPVAQATVPVGRDYLGPHPGASFAR